MEFIEREIKGVYEIAPSPHRDERGFFMRVYDEELFAPFGLNRKWVQENHSQSCRRGIIRGLHFQIGTYSETKLVRCIRGAVFDVAVDVRIGSPTFGRWVSAELTEENMRMLFVPRGFAHGFCTLTDISEVVYKVDNFYSPENERGILWNDRDLSISWPDDDPILSPKDLNNLTLKKYMDFG